MKTKRFRTMFALVSIFICWLIPSSIFASVNVDGIWYDLNSEDMSASVVGSSYEGAIEIPASFNYEGDTYCVTSIGESAFKRRKNLTSVTIPSSVTSIGDQAFRSCSGLTSVTISSGVESIGFFAFYDCSSLTSLEIPSSVTSICPLAFAGCISLTSVAIPSSVTSIASAVFSRCQSLTSVAIPSSVTSIEIEAFAGCTSLASIEIPSSVTSIGHEAFDGTAWYNNQPDGLVYAGNLAYEYKGEMPEGTSITIRNGTVGISGYAFYNCIGLTSVTIPNSLTTIGDNAFEGCAGLNSIIVKSEIPATIDNSVFSSVDKSSCTLYVPKGCKTDYENAESWSEFENIEEELCSGRCGLKYTVYSDMTMVISGTGTISDHDNMGFFNDFIDERQKVLKIIIEDGATSIEEEAFFFSTNLTSVTIPKTVTSIGENAFSQCFNLTSVYISDLTAWCNISFNGSFSTPFSYADCLYLNGVEIKDLVIPDGVSTVKARAFSGCTGLTSVEIPSSVTSIGEYAFARCTGLTSVTIPSSVTSIGSSAFYGCTGLTSITVENEMPISIDNYVFEDVDKSICILYVPAGSKTAYENAEGWKEFQNIVEYDTDISALDNAIYVDWIEGRIGRTMDIPVKVKNSYDFRGFQFTLELPEGTTINSWKLSADRLPEGATLSDKIATQKIEDNRIQVACSLNYGDATFMGNDGEIATVNVTFSEDMEVGEYPIYLTACDISDSGGTDNKLSDIKATLVLEDYVDGDANGDGEVLIGDVVAILNYIVGVTSDNFNEKAADANGDGEILIGDVIAVLNIIVGR